MVIELIDTLENIFDRLVFGDDLKDIVKFFFRKKRDICGRNAVFLKSFSKMRLEPKIR